MERKWAEELGVPPHLRPQFTIIFRKTLTYQVGVLAIEFRYFGKEIKAALVAPFKRRRR